jgi:hypothetical protein
MTLKLLEIEKEMSKTTSSFPKHLNTDSNDIINCQNFEEVFTANEIFDESPF